MKAALTWAILAILLIGFFPAHSATQQTDEPDFFDLLNLTERSEGYYTMQDRESGEVLLRTARIVKVGTEFINHNNRHYRVFEIEDDTAWAELIGTGGTAAADEGAVAAVPVQAEDGGRRPKVGIYHSHGAESYVPSDGTDSIDEGGGILDVGETFSRSLEEQGIEPVHENEETHVPHDAGAYHRSRRTAEDMLVREEVDMLIDVHRDAVPPENYEAVVDGDQVTQILLVVGSQNQNVDSNMQLARDLKEIADKRHPGLVKGILAAPGSYNQDLSARSILIEVGAHENSKEEAEAAVEKFGGVVNEYLNGEAAAPRAGRESGIAGSSVLKLLVALAAAVFVYLLIAAGSWAELKRKATSFFRREFADLGRRIGSKRDDDERD